LYGVDQPTIKNNSFNRIKMPIRFSYAKNSGKGEDFRKLLSYMSEDKVSNLNKNSVVNAQHYYVLFRNEKDMRITYFLVKSDNRLVITPASGPYREMFTDQSTYGNNTKDYFLFQSYMEQLEYSGGGVLTVKAGTYNLSNAVHVPSNVTVNFENGVVINKIAAKYGTSLTVPKAMFVFVSRSLADKSGAVSAYNGSHDIKFIGNGNVTIDCKFSRPGQAIILGHNKNITIRGIDFRRQQGAHFIELNSSYNTLIENCTFQYFRPNAEEDPLDGAHKEAINIDGTDKLTNGFNYVWSARDKTTCKVVTIRNCTFSDMGSAIGSHTYFANGSTPLHHEDIKIYDNTIKNTLHSAIRILNWKNFEIMRNTFDSVGYDERTQQYGYRLYGIHLRGVINPTIKNNTFRNCKWAINVQKTTTATPAASRYPDSVSSISIQNWLDMLDNTLINCDPETDYMRFSNEDYETDPNKDFLDSELPENYRSTEYLHIEHGDRS
jgi:hypothetical protein